MSDKRTEEGFPHSPDPVPGVEARVRQDGVTGDVTVSFGDGSDDLKVDRREFMRISAVAAATATMAGSACRNPVEKIVPYVDRPEKIRIGMPNYYATVCDGCPAQCGVLVQARAGRPIKMEGNPQSPVGSGGLCARGQASYMDLYDPNRAKAPQKIGGGDTTWEELDKAVSAAVGSAKSVRLLTGTNSSPSIAALLNEIKRAGKDVQHHQFDALSEDAALAVAEEAYGTAHIPHYRFDRADVIVSLGADFLGTWLSPVEFTKQFTSRRDPDGDMNRLVVFEPAPTVTGMNADDRHAVPASHLAAVAASLAHVVLVQKKAGPLASNSAVTGALQAFTPEAVAGATGLDAAMITELGTELADNLGAALVVAGGPTSAQPTGKALEAAVSLLNVALAAEGKLVDRTHPSQQALGRTKDLEALVEDMNAGKVDVLIIDGTNPVYSAPNSGFKEALGKVKTVVSTADRVDETAASATWLATSSSALESWGDAEPRRGVYSIRQPSILPLYDTRPLGGSLLAWFAPHVASLQGFLKAPELPAGNRPGDNYPTDSGAWYRYVRSVWQKQIFRSANSLASFDRFWDDTLSIGSYTSSIRQRPPVVRMGALAQMLPKALPEAAKGTDLGAKELQLTSTVQMYDGRQANNGHLQELPDPVTKHVRGDYITLGPKTFKAAGFDAQGGWIEVKVGDTTHEFQAILQPGQAEGVIGIPVGYGRTAAGDIGNDVGKNSFQFVVHADGVRHFGGVAATVKDTGRGEQIAIVQGAQVLDTHRRPIQSFTTLPEYQKDQSAGVNSHPPLPDMWGSHDYSELKWGMAVDLTKCTGCSACVTACVEENNIPVVGRRGILEGREMHWMRIDRYYHLPPEAAKLQKSATSDPMFHREPVVAFADHMENPRVTAQPMMCQHCEHAPCETVCPVSATMHSADGLNQMAYNRCVGTRYCANNCPFKVRRFNWFNYVTDRSDTVIARLYNMVEDGLVAEHGRMNSKEPMPKGWNPDVTVRARGVMEKCTFCVQRIRRAGVQMRKEGRTQVRDGDVIPACQQSCPADAIVFGNLSDENSAVAKLHAKQRALSPLQEVGVHSSVAYLTSVFNSNSTMYHTEGHGHGDGASGGHDEANAADHG